MGATLTTIAATAALVQLLGPNVADRTSRDPPAASPATAALHPANGTANASLPLTAPALTPTLMSTPTQTPTRAPTQLVALAPLLGPSAVDRASRGPPAASPATAVSHPANGTANAS